MSLSILYSCHVGHTTHKFIWGCFYTTGFNILCLPLLYNCNKTIRTFCILPLSSDKAAARLRSLLAAGKSNQ